MSTNIGDNFEKGTISAIAGESEAENIEFNPHPKFKGVFVKHLVTGKTTDNQISCHLVKVEPFCSLDTHVHEKNLEVHEIIDGDGTFYIGGNSFQYQRDSIGVIPANVAHKVNAGENGLYILAKFTPALL